MPHECIIVQVGQCGNQLGCDFWRQCLIEQAFHPQGESLSTFFHNTSDVIEGAHLKIKDGYYGSSGGDKVRKLKARAVLIDMEEGVLNRLLQGPLQDLFTADYRLDDVTGSGSGNNWACGYVEYGEKHARSIEDHLRKQLDLCDSPQSVFLLHSLGGGTGSGLGVRVLECVKDLFPELTRVSASVVPNVHSDDVITSPYNCILSLSHLMETADVILPFENEQIERIAHRIKKIPRRARDRTITTKSSPLKYAFGEAYSPILKSKDIPQSLKTFSPSLFKDVSPTSSAASKTIATSDEPEETPYGFINGTIASVLCDITAGMRYGGELNVDISELNTNMVPFSSLNLLIPSLSPLSPRTLPLSLREACLSVFSRDCCMCSDAASSSGPAVKPGSKTGGSLGRTRLSYFQSACTLSCGVFGRGARVCVEDMSWCIEKQRGRMKMPIWAVDGFKVGVCSQGAVRWHQGECVELPYSFLSLSNSTAITNTLDIALEKIDRLFGKKLYWHHYAKHLALDDMKRAIERVRTVRDEYKKEERSLEDDDGAIEGSIERGGVTMSVPLDYSKLFV
ncbi:putative multi-domain containing protein [Aduncisulcus paluster]|uniref:Multi-domain containing protein n=1 Tax=Aduncisulcus paluster TaxID=2918883 RepID=A0ABQ5KW75_9EUKA|nr:putative multi-domain containing protein [Aduncisulcus paluster]